MTCGANHNMNSHFRRSTTGDLRRCAHRSSDIVGHRPGFTLVELLVTIAIITLLASTLLVGMAGVQESAKIDKTRSLIARIHELIAAELEEYETKRVTPRFDSVLQVPAVVMNISQPNNRGIDPRIVRLQAIRELMRIELPDRYSDFYIAQSVRAGLSSNSPHPLPLTALNGVPSVVYGYEARVDSTTDSTVVAARNESAECLYLIISRINIADSSALEFFHPREIGDTDGDGMPEFVDAWGTPISWLRWPTGFVSPLQPDVRPVVSVDVVGAQRDQRADHDPFDPFEMDPGTKFGKYVSAPYFWLRAGDPTVAGASPAPHFTGFRSFPLIISAGPDKDMDLFFTQITGSTAVDLAVNTVPPNDPYAVYPNGTTGTFHSHGAPVGPNYVDNISNHLIETR